MYFFKRLKLYIWGIRFKKKGKYVTYPKNGIIQNPEKIELSDYVHISSFPDIYAAGGLKIGKNVVIGPRVTIHTINHNYDSDLMLPYDNISFQKPVIIEDNVWIASNVTIVPGVTIGEGSVVASGSVITKNIAPLSVVGGNPAKLIKKRDEERYKRLNQNQMWYLKLKSENKIKTNYI